MQDKELRKFLALLCVCLLGVGGCAPSVTQIPTQREKGVARVETFAASYDAVFSSVVRTLCANGYMVRRANKEMGLIGTDFKRGDPALFDSPSSDIYRSRVNASVRKIAQNSTEVRLNLIMERWSAKPTESRKEFKASYGQAEEIFNLLFEDIEKSLDLKTSR